MPPALPKHSQLDPNGNAGAMQSINHKPETINHNIQTPTPTPINGQGFKKIGFGFNGVGRKLQVIDITGSLQAADIFEIERVAPKWDIEHLAKVYVDGINSGSREPPRSIPKAFPKWCAKYTKGKAP